MLTYYVSIGEREYRVKIGDSQVWLDDEPVTCRLTSLNGNGLHQLSRESQSVEVHLSSDRRGGYEVLIGGRRLVAQVAPGHRRAAGQQGGAESGALTALMPGLIVEVPVQVGDTVAEGEVLVVQEAMKMQMPLRAPCAGRVIEVRVEAGAEVEQGALLVRLAPGA